MRKIIKNPFAPMQKVAVVKLCIVSLFCLFTSIVNAQETWDYPVKPGMEQWNQFKSVDEMYQACQMPENLLKQLDTESLFEVCLSFPAPPIFPLYNTPQQGFIEYYINFNEIRELFHRKDVGLYLLKKYKAMSLSEFNTLWPLYQQGRFVNHYKFVETIMSQPQVIASLDVKERKMLLKEAIYKMDEKISMTDLFSGFSLDINLWVIGKLLFAENESAFKEYDQQNLQTALKTGMFVDIDVDMLYKQAKKYVYENE